MNCVALASAKPAPLWGCFLELFMRREVGRPASKSISACCHLQKRTIDKSVVVDFSLCTCFSLMLFAGKRKYNCVCDCPRFNLVYFVFFLFFFRSFILFISCSFPPCHLSLSQCASPFLCLSLSPSCCLLTVYTHVNGIWGPVRRSVPVWASVALVADGLSETDLEDIAKSFFFPFYLVCLRASLIFFAIS